MRKLRERMNALRAFQHRSDALTLCSSLLNTTTQQPPPHYTPEVVHLLFLHPLRTRAPSRGRALRAYLYIDDTGAWVKGNSLVLFTDLVRVHTGLLPSLSRSCAG